MPKAQMHQATVTFDLSDETTAGIKVEVSDGVDWATINLNPTAYEEQIKTLTYESEAAVYNLSDAKAYTYYLKFATVQLLRLMLIQ